MLYQSKLNGPWSSERQSRLSAGDCLRRERERGSTFGWRRGVRRIQCGAVAVPGGGGGGHRDGGLHRARRPNGIQDTLGRKADSFTGQVVTNNTAPADAGRSDPAQTPGTADSLDVVRHESGKLRAFWDAPNSGPTPTGYTVQWKESGEDWADQDDVSEANVKGTSHVITGLTDGLEYAVRVIAYKDDAESAPSGEVTATPQETVPPAPSAASVDGATLTITFEEPLDPGETPDRSAFAATVAGAGRGVETIAVWGSGVTITRCARATR